MARKIRTKEQKLFDLSGGHRRMVPVCRVVTAEGDLVDLARSDVAARTGLADLLCRAPPNRCRPRLQAGLGRDEVQGKFGTFPPWSWNDDQTATATVTTLQWVKSRQIAYARMAAS